MLGITHKNRLPVFFGLSLLVHIVFLFARSQEATLAPIRAPRNDRAIHISLKNVTMEGHCPMLIEQKINPDRTRPHDIKPLPPVVKRVSVPPHIQTQRSLTVPVWKPVQHAKADRVLFHASQMVSGDSSAEETYFSRIRRLIEASKRYPESARRAGIEGYVGIRFSINRQGYLAGKVEVVRSSGFSALDRAAVACVEKVGAFPPFPDTFKKALLKIRIDLVFEMRGKS